MAGAAGVEREVLRQVLRGERPMADLRQIGIEVTFKGDRTRIRNPRRLTVAAYPEDLARGLLHYRDRPNELQKWVWLVLARSSMYDLEMESDERAEVLMNTLMDLSFGGEVRPEALEAARDLAAEEAGG